MSTVLPTHTSLSESERAEVRELITRASQPLAPTWPMKSAVAQNPIHGLECLPFDEAVRKGTKFRGGQGYLPNETFRKLFREGRITAHQVQQAMNRVGPKLEADSPIAIGPRQISPQDVWLCHLHFGIDPLPTRLLDWELGPGGALTALRPDLPPKVKTTIIEQTIRECEQCRDNPEQAYLSNLWQATLAALECSSFQSPQQDHTKVSPPEFGLPPNRTLSDWVGALSGTPLVDHINSHLTKWVVGFLDEGLADWAMPDRGKGFYTTWKELALYDHSGRIAGVGDWKTKIQNLADSPEDTIVLYLDYLGLTPSQRSNYLSRMLCQLPGWASYIRWLGEHPSSHSFHQIDPVQYLAVRLFYEVEWTGMACRQAWNIDGTLPALIAYWEQHLEEYQYLLGNEQPDVDALKEILSRDVWRLFQLAQCLQVSPLFLQDLTRQEAHTVLNWLESFPSDRHGPVWLEAYEEGFRSRILGKLAAHRGTLPQTDDRPRAQLVFCIDVRSESFRRHVEAQGPYETFGFAGFFGIPINHQAFDQDERTDLCPVLLTPNHAVREAPRASTEDAVSRYFNGTRWGQLGEHLFHDLKHNPVGSMMLIDVLGLFYSAALFGKTVVPKLFHSIRSAILGWFDYPVPTHIALKAQETAQTEPATGSSSHPTPEGLAQGFSLTERATFIEGGLRVMGLTTNFGRFVALCGHGSETDNNPYYAALDCGACGGKPGDANARVFAAMANDSEVRHILKERGLPIPEDTWFVPGKHNTTTDRVTFYDLEDLPASHQEDFRLMQQDLETAGANQALERCQRMPRAPKDISPAQAFSHIDERSLDWANPRPEWGLAGNGAFLIGQRWLTKGLPLDGRVFLHSYNPHSDPEGRLLEKIMTAPLIVGEWINTGYYFSSVDPWNYGSGSKVLHNVVSGVGVMLGSQSDLQLGFPLQTVNNGNVHYHEPIRLLAIIEATPDVISSIIQKHAILQQLFHKQWLNLISLHPTSGTFHRYQVDARWEEVAMS